MKSSLYLRSPNQFLAHIVVAAILCLATTASAADKGRPKKIFREGQATFHALDPAKLPAGTSPVLFAGVIMGETFDLSVRNLDAQVVTIELGFVDTQSSGPQQHTFSLSANGTPLDANLDVWAKAGGAYKPWVDKLTFNHAGGSLAIQFASLEKSAFVSYARILDANGNELIDGTATDWKKPERLTLLDSRSRPFQAVSVGEVPFFDSDHSPIGAWATLVYGMEGSGGVQVCKQPGGIGTLIPHQGIIVAAKSRADGTHYAIRLPTTSIGQGRLGDCPTGQANALRVH